MVQESIVDYINAQMKLGVSRDVIKTTLTGAGWAPADVEDTLKKVESTKMAQPMTAAPAAAATSSTVTAKPIASAGSSMGTGAEPQIIKMSDLVSSAPAITSTAAAMPAKAVSSASTAKSPLTRPATMSSNTTAATTFQATTYPGMKSSGSRKTLITEIVLGVVILVVAAFAGFLFVQNGSLNSQLSSLNGQSAGVTSQLSVLQTQVAASTTALTAQVATLGSNIQELQTELSFYIAPSGTTPGATSSAMVSGTVSGGGKTPYVIMATYGAKIFVTNSKVASVIAALASLLASAGTTSAGGTVASSTTSSSTNATSTAAVSAKPATVAQFSGTYTPGSDSITLTEVNGVPLQ